MINALLHIILSIIAATAALPERTVTGGAFQAPLLQDRQTPNTAEHAQRELNQAPAEEALPSDRRLREARLAKNARYNSRGPDLTRRGSESFIDQEWPRALPIIPAKESNLTVVAEVVRMQPYLSKDHSRIYTEITVRPEEVIKSDQHLETSSAVVIDRVGGVLRTQSGQIVNDNIMIDGLGRTRIGGRYILFAKKIHNGRDLTLIRGYELRAGRVFRLEDNGNSGSALVSSTPGASDIPSDEKSFLEAACRKAHM